ncbi:MAG: ATP-binding cassette domain-containing protein, partial [Deltaproteobacteria bacterium]|nr:ATP-binding cassette domain-containing protein [Deltaproteobacteria bacterium]
NVMIPALIAGESRKPAAARAQRLLERVGLGPRLKHKPGEMSGGEQQRVALARALVMQPEAVLADEPTGNLDRDNSNEIIDLLMECNRDFNTTLMLVTHSLRLAKRMGRRITLENGCLHEN